MKLNRKSTFIFWNLLIATIIVGYAAFFPKNEFTLSKIRANNSTGYTINFKSDENTLNSELNETTVLTSSGNPLSFTYEGYSEVPTLWGELTNSGFFANKTAISGLQNISIDFEDMGRSITVAYGWWNEDMEAIVYEEEGIIHSNESEYDFNQNLPSFFKISVMESVEITSITVYYTCVESKNPFLISNLEKLTFVNKGGYYEITDCNAEWGTIQIPSTYNGLPVKSIGYRAFYDCWLINSIYIPSSVTSIGEEAFAMCATLGTIVIPDSVTSIGVKAFLNCYNLTAITLSANLTILPNNAFQGCRALTEIEIPNSITQIHHYVFQGCSSLSTITIPANVSYLGYYVFRYCTNLKSVNILSTSIPTIFTETFSECTSLMSIDIPTNVTSVGDNAFSYCLSLTSITIPATVTNISLTAFKGCESLSNIAVDENNQNYTVINSALLDKEMKILIRYFGQSSDYVIPGTVEVIATNAFANNLTLISVTIPSSVITINNEAFKNCESLTSVTMGSSVKSIGELAFSQCYELADINIPSSVETIGYEAFSFCGLLTSITIPASVISIEAWAFFGCNELTIKCEAESKPITWNEQWNFGNNDVEWGVII